VALTEYAGRGHLSHAAVSGTLPETER
jgi:hypothetical protein